jgi:excisionase family DNA binding protein
MDTPQIEPMYTPEDLSQRLNVSVQTITRWVRAGRVPGQRKVGHVWRFYPADVEKALLKDNFLLAVK